MDKSTQQFIEEKVEQLSGSEIDGKLAETICVETDDLRQALTEIAERVREEERKELAEQFVKIEKEKWEDAEHCSCLGYAVVTVFGEKYEQVLLSPTSNEQE